MAELDFAEFEVLTFDCYGTLIDWETGISNGLRPALARQGLEPGDDELLEAYARAEAAAEAGPYRRYREILADSMRAVCEAFGFEATPGELSLFADSVGDWPPFGDSPSALASLKTRFGLGVITNCDVDLFARSNTRLGVAFDWVITAQQVGSYKPDLRNFRFAFDRIGVPPARILHVAQSLFHDHVPARELGLSTVWVNRRQDKPGSGATPTAVATPDLTVPDMATLAELALA
jgi:2-haloacid dehalogenase